MVVVAVSVAGVAVVVARHCWVNVACLNVANCVYHSQLAACVCVCRCDCLPAFVCACLSASVGVYLPECGYHNYAAGLIIKCYSAVNLGN